MIVLINYYYTYSEYYIILILQCNVYAHITRIHYNIWWFGRRDRNYSVVKNNWRIKKPTTTSTTTKMIIKKIFIDIIPAFTRPRQLITATRIRVSEKNNTGIIPERRLCMKNKYKIKKKNRLRAHISPEGTSESDAGPVTAAALRATSTPINNN